MAPQLRVLNALLEVPGLTPNTHMAAHKHLQLQFQGIQCHFLFSMATRYTSATQTQMHTKQPQQQNKQPPPLHTHIKESNNKNWVVVVSAFKPSSREAETSRSPRVQCQFQDTGLLHRETLSRNSNKTQTNRKEIATVLCI